jgi:hypothetical protein
MKAFQQSVQFLAAPRGKLIPVPVPAGKALMIEFLTATFTLNGIVAAPCIFIHCTLGGVTVSHAIELDQHDPNNFGLAQLVKLYADPNTPVGVQVSSVNGGVFNGNVTLVGQLS